MNLKNIDKFVYHVSAKETVRREALKQMSNELGEIKG